MAPWSAMMGRASPTTRKGLTAISRVSGGRPNLPGRLRQRATDAGHRLRPDEAGCLLPLDEPVDGPETDHGQQSFRRVIRMVAAQGMIHPAHQAERQTGARNQPAQYVMESGEISR